MSESKHSSSFRPPVEKISDDEAQALLLQLRRKEGGWIAWGQACERLQKSGYSSLVIFEETGFEAVHQLQVSVGLKVYDSLVEGQAPAAVLEHYHRKGSDILYELRQLGQENRIKAAQFCLERNLDMDEARALAKDFREMQWLKEQTPGFDNEPGDAVAYFCWKRARERKDLQERSRLIAQGLRYAQSASARARLEELLTDFTLVSVKSAPLPPIYRLETEEDLPRLIPVAGALPMTQTELEAVPDWEESGAFRVVRAESPISWVALPGWQRVLGAKQPVAIYAQGEQVPNLPNEIQETVLLVIDRAATTWDDNSYFLMDQEGSLGVRWFAEAPTQPILGQVVVVVRPRRILDESLITTPWQLE